ncbi:MAG: hypothetical protein EXS48_02225 [Candidatus Staskawiczbacteria bacterium]|nr:hypothetical protein [Candidatus Staskawiczbacteria bacterium]
MNKKIIFIILGMLVVISAIVFFYYRDTVFSKEILKLEILGPAVARMGEEIEYTVKYKNNGNFVLQGAKITFELPENSLTEDSKIRFTQNIEDIYPGAEAFVKFKTRLLGKEGDLKVARATLSYMPKNLSVRYESHTTLTTIIDTVFITLNFDMPSKIEKGKELSFDLNYFSNTDYPLENMSIKIAPVNGFTITSADPASLDDAEWKLDTLNKGQGGRINIKGVIGANASEPMHFSARLGMWQNGNFFTIKEAAQDVEMIAPLILMSQQINGSANYVASPGDTLRYEIFLRNISPTPFMDLFAMSRLSGSAFDLSTLQSSDGQVRANDNLIVWDAKQISRLQNLKSQEEVKVSFTVKLKNNWIPSDAEKNNVVVKNKVTVSNVDQEFVTKVNSKIELSQKAYHSTQSGIENSGPIPPEVGKATTYAVVWQVKNYFNNLKNVKVKAALPSSVFLSDAMFPEDQASNFSFDSASREIVWLVGNLASEASTSLTFQISLTPTSMQQGSTAALLSQATIYGEDQSTGAVAQSGAGTINASLPDDPGNSGGGIVQ